MQYDLLVGADGAGSAVRTELQKVMPPEYIKRRSHTAVYATGPLELTNPDQLPKHTYTTMDSFEACSVLMLLSSLRSIFRQLETSERLAASPQRLLVQVLPDIDTGTSK